MIFFGEQSLRGAIRQFGEHHHVERNHQGLGNSLIEPEDGVGECRGDIECRERLGGASDSVVCCVTTTGPPLEPLRWTESPS
jgi:hypothetical protein